jgi:hypothetical protein
VLLGHGVARGLVLLLALASCKHEPERAESAASDVVAGELMVGTDGEVSPDAVLAAVALDGYRFEYVAAASPTSHLVKATHADGAALDAAATQELVSALTGRAGVRYVELNHVRQPRQ